MLRTRLLVTTAAFALGLTTSALAAAPANDNFAAAIGLSGTSASASYTTAEATKQVGEPGVGLGAKTVWFKWTAGSPGAAYVDVCGAASMHYVKVYRPKPGQAEAVTALDDARVLDQELLPADSACRARWRATAGTKYFIQINHAGAAPAHSLVLSQDTSPPAAPTLGAWPSVTKNHEATFSTPGATSYACELDGVGYKLCTSPHWIAFQPDGEHTFRVRAVDGHGNLSMPTARTWRVDANGPEIAFTSPVGVTEARPTFTWATSEPGQTYCSVDGGGVGMCSSPWQAGIWSPGEHRLEVFAKDAYGNRGPTAVATWIVPEPQPQAIVQNWTNPQTQAMHDALPCTMRLLPPASTTRAALRRGIRVRVTAEAGRCAQTLVVRQGTRKLVTRAVALVGPSGTDVLVKTRAARRGRLVLTLNGLRRVMTVR